MTVGRGGPDPNDLVPLTDDEKLMVVPELGRRAATLFALARLDMIRDARNADEERVWGQLREYFPSIYPPESSD
jgi:hypothetical protein